MKSAINLLAETEEEFIRAVDEVSYFQGDIERVTIDKEWTESELKDDIWEETHKILHGTNGQAGWLSKNSSRALKDDTLTKEEYIVEDICNRYDIIEVYNRALDKHRNDKPVKFGIVYFDELVHAEVNKVLRDNLITK